MSAEKTYRIVVGFDFSELAERAFAEALALAAHHPRVDVHVVTVAEDVASALLLPGANSPVHADAAQATLRERVNAMIERHRSQVGPVFLERVTIDVLSSAGIVEPGRLIVRLASSVDANLVVVGTHGRRGLSSLFLGSVAQQIVREATMNVYVVRPADMVGGNKVPAIEPPLEPGQPHLKPFEHRRTYHYVDKVSNWTSRTMPVS